MIVLHGRGAVYGELWYDDDPDTTAGIDILVYRRHRGSRAEAGGIAAPRVLTDLACPRDDIMAAFGANCRYDIRRADSRDGLDAEFVDHTAERLAEFRAFYDVFAAQKAIGGADPAWLLAASQSRQLALSAARWRGQVIVWHGYVLSGATAGLQYSCSLFRGDADEVRAVTGRANRWLHWQDMLRFKSNGYRRYDWGGLFAAERSPEEAGINAFKLSFGPRVEPAWDRAVALTPRGFAWLYLRRAWLAAAQRWPRSKAHCAPIQRSCQS